MRDYERLSIEDFGRHLIKSGDLDPVYISLPKTLQKPADQGRFLVAYFCSYHVGFSCYASEHTGPAFWERMMTWAKNETPSPVGGRWPRASERRHARGEAGIKMVMDLQKRYGDKPERMMEVIEAGAPDYKSISTATKQHHLFGDWLSFKAADIVDRVRGKPVDFSQAHVFMFKDPVKASMMLWRQKAGFTEGVSPKNKEVAIKSVCDYLLGQFDGLKAPPFYDRELRLNEIETVLCKWKSHMNGHYPLNNDLIEIGEGLEGWGNAAMAFKHNLPVY